MKLFYKYVRNHDQTRTLNEKYDMYLHSVRRIINTDTHTTKSTNYNKVQVTQDHLDWGGTITVYCNSLGT